ncbi:MAG: type I methionyl aminopeptidase [Clostridiales bacterium]|nr:type I methionyl aminopeptidase [Clostridiales bacterium]
MIIIKSEKEIEIMKVAGGIVAGAHKAVKDAIRPGITTKELDNIAREYIESKEGYPSFKGYQGFPASICASINNEVIHGIPRNIALKDGDIISIDIGAIYNGYHGDAARTHPVGNVSPEALKLIDVARDSFYAGIKYAKLGYRLSDISHRIQAYVEERGYSVVRAYVGHGIGQQMHEDPQIPNYGSPGRGPRLRKGMTLAIEPMINEGTYEVDTLDDGWTVVTRDGKLSAHYENTIAITDGDPIILTCESG